MWTELAYAIALEDYWMRIRRSGRIRSREALFILLALWASHSIADFIIASRPGASAQGALREEEGEP